MFMGINIEDPEIANLVKWVVRITAGIIILAIINFVIDLVLGQFYNVLGLIISFSIAACGYYGAKKRDKQLLCCFCGWNLTFAIMSILSTIVAVFNLFYLAQFVDCKQWKDTAFTIETATCLCCKSEEAMQNPDEHQLREYLEAGECAELDLGKTECNKEEVKLTIHIFVVLIVISIILQCFAFSYGKKLHNMEYFDVRAQTVQEPVMAQAVVSQPVVATQAFPPFPSATPTMAVVAEIPTVGYGGANENIPTAVAVAVSDEGEGAGAGGSEGSTTPSSPSSPSSSAVAAVGAAAAAAAVPSAALAAQDNKRVNL
jgi:hypothetical protein